MSLKTNVTKGGGANRRYFDQDTTFAPFEVIDVGDSKVAINEGVVIIGSSSIYLNDEMFSGNCKPQDLLGGDVSESKYLTVKKGDYVVLVLKNNDSSKPKAEIKAVAPADLDKTEFKRKENRVVKLAIIKDSKSIEGQTYLNVENVYASHVISETENYPAFTPIMWPVEKELTEGGGGQTGNAWKAVFVPGSIYLPQTMDECKFFEINGVSMIDLPVIEVKAGDKYYITYEIDKEWKIKGKPAFTKSPGDKKIVKVVPDGPECDESTSTSDSPCSPKEGYFKLKVLEFIARDGGLFPKIYYRSDVCIYGWERCPPQCDGDDSSGSDDDSGNSSDGSSGGSDEPSSEDSSSDDSSDEPPDPDPTGTCYMEVDVSLTIWGVAYGASQASGGYDCELPDLRACFLGSDFNETSPGGVGSFVYCTATATATPGASADCSGCGNGFGQEAQGYVVAAVGGFKNKSMIRLDTGGNTTVCAIVGAGPCSYITATGYIETPATVAHTKPECSGGNVADTATDTQRAPAMGTTGGTSDDPADDDYEDGTLYCDTCDTTPNPPGPP